MLTTKKLRVPEGFHDLKIGQLQEIIALNERKLDRLQSLAHFVSILCKVDYETAIEISLTDLLNIEAELMWVYHAPKDGKIKKNYKLGKLQYEAILDLSKITAGQYITAKHTIQKGVSAKNMHQLLAVFFVPFGLKYSTEVYEQACKDVYDHLNCQDAFALQSFFLTSSEILTHVFQSYIIENTVKAQLKTLRSSLNGDGS